jgi:hypothetical protein
MTAPNVTATNPSPTSPAPTTSAPPTGETQTPASTPAPPRTGAEETGFKFNTGPDWLRGKTASEAADLAQRLYEQNQQLAQQVMNRGAAPMAPSVPYGVPTQQPAWQPNPPQWTPQPPSLPSQEEWLANPAQSADRYSQYLQTMQAQQMNPMVAQVASTNRELVRVQRTDDFKRWGPEIDMAINQFAPDPQARTPQNLLAIVDMVKARHIDEIVAEKTASLKNELGGAAIRPSGSGQPGTSTVAAGNVDFDKMPPQYALALKRLNVDAKTIDEFLYRTYVKSGMEPDIDKARERWVTQVNKGDVFSDNKELASGVY